ncbi:MAG: L-2-hydroxyglutarate oxidase [Pseudomonadota bacterium]
MSQPCDLAIVGGGILGLATALTYLTRYPGAGVVLIEREDSLARHQTGRNSGVIHAGVYYAPGSLKARYCRRGAAMTKRLASAWEVDFEVCGKIVVATDTDEVPRLEAIAERSARNDVPLTPISASELGEIEPDIVGCAAYLSPTSGIADYPSLCAAMARRISELGGEIRLGTALRDLSEGDESVRLATDGEEVTARHMVACAGLQADRIAALSGVGNGFRIVPFRGEYYEVSSKWSGRVAHLIYPVPDPTLPFLGVHLTRMTGDRLTVGPNAMLSMGRERYARNVPDMRDISASVSYLGFWKLMLRHRKSAIYELAGSLSKRVYLKRCQRYCPSLTLSDLIAHPTGIRAQAVGNDGKMIDDFLIRETTRTTHVCNAPSPAATSALPIAEHICDRIDKRDASIDMAGSHLNPAEAADRLIGA